MTKYFGESLQLYVPPQYMMHRDFLKAVLAGQKKFMPLKEVSRVVVPKYEELSVEKVYPLVQVDPAVNAYFPDSLPKNRNVSREYFWNILHTVHPLYVERLISHAQQQRFAGGAED